MRYIYGLCISVCIYIWVMNISLYIYIWAISIYVCINICVRAKSLPLCQTLFDPMDCSQPGSSVHGILFFFLICSEFCHTLK